MKWTKKFNVDDIVPHREKLESAIQKEGGMVNNYMKKKKKRQNQKKKIEERLSESVQPPASQYQTGFIQDVSTPNDASTMQRVSESRDIKNNEKEVVLSGEEVKDSVKYNETDGFSQMKQKPIFANQPGKGNVPLSNTMLKESLSSKQDSPMNQTKESPNFPKPGQNEESKTLLQKHKQNIPSKPPSDTEKLPNIENLTEHDITETQPKDLDFEYPQNHLESPRTEVPYEDASQLHSPSDPLDYSHIRAQYKPEPYKIEEISHLFIEGKIPLEIEQISDPMEYNYLLVKLK